LQGENLHLIAPTTILLVDDHPLLRKGVAQLINLEADLNVIAEASNGEDALKVATALKPDLILLDLNMRGMSGIETLRALKVAEIPSKVVVFTVSDDDEDIINVIKQGADGYILKDSEPEILLNYIRMAAKGEMALSPKLTQILAKAVQQDNNPKQFILDQLTDRELDILKLISLGDSNKVIARKLDISEGTVKVHVKHLLKKMALRSRVEAAVWAVEYHVK